MRQGERCIYRLRYMSKKYSIIIYIHSFKTIETHQRPSKSTENQ